MLADDAAVMCRHGGAGVMLARVRNSCHIRHERPGFECVRVSVAEFFLDCRYACAKPSYGDATGGHPAWQRRFPRSRGGSVLEQVLTVNTHIRNERLVH